MKGVPLICRALAAASIGSYLAFRTVGWIGVGVLGLLTAFIAVRVEIEQDGPVGSQQNTELFTSSLRGRERMTRSERGRAETGSRLRAGNLGKIIGAVLILVGFGGFFLFQL